MRAVIEHVTNGDIAGEAFGEGKFYRLRATRIKGFEPEKER